MCLYCVRVCVREEFCSISPANYRAVVVELLITCAACEQDFLGEKEMCSAAKATAVPNGEEISHAHSR